MVCPKCNSDVVEGAAFCSACGEKITSEQSESSAKYCSACGEALKGGDKFCGKCGLGIGMPVKAQPNASNVAETSSNKISGSYYASVISAIISLIIRLTTQDVYYSYMNILENRKVLGLDSDVKPFLTVIPIIAAIIASLLIVSDKKVSSQKKTTAFIVNAIFIALAILFIWFDIPYAIIDF